MSRGLGTALMSGACAAMASVFGKLAMDGGPTQRLHPYICGVLSSGNSGQHWDVSHVHCDMEEMGGIPDQVGGVRLCAVCVGGWVTVCVCVCVCVCV